MHPPTHVFSRRNLTRQNVEGSSPLIRAVAWNAPRTRERNLSTSTRNLRSAGPFRYRLHASRGIILQSLVTVYGSLPQSKTSCVMYGRMGTHVEVHENYPVSHRSFPRSILRHGRDRSMGSIRGNPGLSPAPCRSSLLWHTHPRPPIPLAIRLPNRPRKDTIREKTKKKEKKEAYKKRNVREKRRRGH